MRFIFSAAALATCAASSFTHGEPILLHQERFVHVSATLANYPLVFSTEISSEIGERLMEVSGESSWLGWRTDVESSLLSDIFTNGIWGEGYVATISEGHRWDYNYFVGMAANQVRGTFAVDVATPYEFYLRGLVVDPTSAPDWTDVSFHLFGPGGLVETRTIHDGQDEYLANGLLPPGEYRYTVGALATLRGNISDDAAHVSHMYYLVLPEPTTLFLLISTVPVICRRRVSLR